MREPTEREWLEGLRYEDKFPPHYPGDPSCGCDPCMEYGGQLAELEREREDEEG